MSPARDHLTDALHELAAASPQGPTPELSERLRMAFQHHHRRRRIRRAVVGSCVALLVVIACAALWINKTAKPVSSAKKAQPVMQIDDKPPARQKLAPENAKTVEPPYVATHTKAPVKAKPKPVSVRHEPATRIAQTQDFVALPTFDSTIPLGQSRMVRMDLPGSALQLMGYPLNGSLLDSHVVTDVLVSQDGMPYAVRLVQARNIH